MPNQVGPGELDKVGVTCGIAEHPAVVPELDALTEVVLDDPLRFVVVLPYTPRRSAISRPVLSRCDGDRPARLPASSARNWSRWGHGARPVGSGCDLSLECTGAGPASRRRGGPVPGGRPGLWLAPCGLGTDLRLGECPWRPRRSWRGKSTTVAVVASLRLVWLVWWFPSALWITYRRRVTSKTNSRQ